MFERLEHLHHIVGQHAQQIVPGTVTGNIEGPFHLGFLPFCFLVRRGRFTGRQSAQYYQKHH